MLELLTRAGSLPFSVALALMLMFALLQIVGKKHRPRTHVLR